MDRDRLARLLDGGGEAVSPCRRALLAGARFWVSEVGQPASVLAPTYERREAHTRQIGIPTLGFVEAVRALRMQGDRLVRLAAVDVDDVPYHFQLFRPG